MILLINKINYLIESQILCKNPANCNAFIKLNLNGDRQEKRSVIVLYDQIDCYIK